MMADRKPYQVSDTLSLLQGMYTHLPAIPCLFMFYGWDEEKRISHSTAFQVNIYRQTCIAWTL